MFRFDAHIIELKTENLPLVSLSLDYIIQNILY